MPSANAFLSDTPAPDATAAPAAPPDKSASGFLGSAGPKPRPSLGNLITEGKQGAEDVAAGLGKFITESRPQIESTVRRAGGEAIDSLRGVIDERTGRMSHNEADYDTGLPWHVRAQLAAADPVKGDKERQLVINKYLPGAQITYDKKGRMLVKPQGAKKWLAADGGGFWNGLAADTVGNALPVTGGVAALTAVAPEMTAMVAGGGPIGAVGAGALGLAALYGGGFVGKGIDEVRKGFQGLLAGSNEEQLGAMNRAGGESVKGEIIGRAGGRILGSVRKYPELFGGQTTASKDMTEDMLKRGYRPDLKTAAPESVRPGYVQKTIDKITTSVRHAQNAQALENDVKQTLGALGMDPNEQQDVLDQILRKNVDARDYGETIAKKVKEYVKASEETLTSQREALTAQSDEDLAKLTKSMGTADKDALSHIQDDIAKGKSDLMNRYRAQYEGVWKMTGEQPLFDTKAIRSTAEDLLKRLPPTAKAELAQVAPDVVEGLEPWLQEEIKAASEQVGAQGGPVERIWIGKNREMLDELRRITKLSPMITPQQAHTLRSQFLAMERDAEFTRNFAGFGRGKLTDALEKGFDDLETRVPGFSTQLREINAGYRKEIGKFDNASVNQIMRDARLGGSIAPERVLEFVKNPNHFREVWNVIGPETQAKVRALDFADVVGSATDVQTGVIDGRAFAKALAKREEVGPQLYGRRYQDAVKIAQKYAAMDGQLNTNAIKPSADFLGDVERVQRAEEDLQKQLTSSGGWLKALGKEGVIGERAMKLTAVPGQAGESRLIEAAKFYGSDSPEMGMVRKYALTKLFADAAQGEQNTIADAILSGNLKKEWNRWTPKQKELLFGGLAPEIDGLVQRIDHITPEKEGLGFGSLAAGAINLGGFSTYPITLLAIAGDHILARPNVIRWFAGNLGETALPMADRSAAEIAGQGVKKAAKFQSPDAELNALVERGMRDFARSPAIAARWIARTKAQSGKNYQPATTP